MVFSAPSTKPLGPFADSLHGFARTHRPGRVCRYRRRSPLSVNAIYEERPKRVVGFGSSAIDYLALVARYPKPDQKMRTEELKVQGGGNCGNALTLLAKLGLTPVLLTMLGDDEIGSRALRELESDGVDTSNVIISKNAPSPFTYVIVDKEGGTRTCVHTPAAPLTPDRMTPDVIARLLNGADLVFFDGRLTEAALLVAKEARKRGIKILVEGERLRPNLDRLMELADYIVTSAYFPQDMTGKKYLGDAMLSLMTRFPNAERIVTTLGSKGSIAVERIESESKVEGDGIILEDLLTEEMKNREPLNGDTPWEADSDCVSKDGIKIRCGSLREYPATNFIHKQIDYEETVQRARDAALTAATNYAAIASVQQFRINSPDHDSSMEEVAAKLWVASAAHIEEDAVVDTTGAGDTFIGATLYGLQKGMSTGDTLHLASVCAACKCTALGARAGQPGRKNLVPTLLGETGSSNSDDHDYDLRDNKSLAKC